VKARVLRAVVLAAAVVASAVGAGAVPHAADQTILTTTLNRVGGRVREYYQRAQSILSTETVQMQTLGGDMSPVGPARRLVYELRTEWNAPGSPGALPEADVVRKLLTVNGRAPNPSDEPGCADPRTVSPEPLFMLLPEHRREFGFLLGKPQKLGTRVATMIEYISLPVGSNEPTWKKDCVSIPLEGRTVGRIWIDADTDDVLRLEEHLVGMIDVKVPRDYARTSGQLWMSLERVDFSIRYKPVSFTDPDEVVTLPASIERLGVFRGSGVSRMRITQTYSGYRRFLTNSRLMPPAN
jgi:hypothetical protein